MQKRDDGLNRRIRKIVYDANEAEVSDTRFLYDGWRCVEERDINDSQELRARYACGGLYVDEVLREYRDTNSDGAFDNANDVNVYCLQDRLFNVVALTDTEGAIVERTWYEPYGKPTNRRESDGDVTAPSHFGNPILFTGHRLDDDTGLFYARNRQLNVDLGEWAQRDPIEYAIGISLYEYTASSPAGRVDPSGLKWRIERDGQHAKATAIPERGDTVAALAKEIGLSPTEAIKWITWEPTNEYLWDNGRWLKKGGYGSKGINDGMTGCEWFEVPNTVIGYWGGAGGGFGRWWVMWKKDVNTLQARGFKVVEKEFAPVEYERLGPGGRTIPGARTHGEYRQMIESQIADFLGWFRTGTTDKTLHGVFFWGHGGFSLWCVPGHPLQAGTRVITPRELRNALQYELALGILWGCEMMEMYGNPAVRKGIFSATAIVEGGSGTLVPHGVHLFGRTVEEIVPPGVQGTRR